MSFTTPSLWAQKGNESVSKGCCDVEIRHFPCISCIQSHIYTSKCMYKYVIISHEQYGDSWNWINFQVKQLKWLEMGSPNASSIIWFLRSISTIFGNCTLYFFWGILRSHIPQYASNSISWASKTITLDLTNDVKFIGLDLKQEMNLRKSWIIEPESILQRLA